MRNHLQLVTLVLCFFANGSAWAEPLPLKYFVQHGDYLDLKISPDGEHLAARIRQDDSVYLVIIRTSDREVVGGARPNSGSQVHSVTWVNNERVVF